MARSSVASALGGLDVVPKLRRTRLGGDLWRTTGGQGLGSQSMATGTVYLDVDDEITSAAARIRGSEATKVALVVPYGSRIATSRMNFRLLAREALVNNRVLSIVSTDAATRALAASAGLPVFVNVVEWDASAGAAATMAPPPGYKTDLNGDIVASTDAPKTVDAESAVRPAIAADTAPPVTGSRSRKKASAAPLDEVQTLGLAVAAGGAVAASESAASAASIPAPVVERVRPEPASTPSASRIPVAKNRSMPRIGAPAIFIAAALILALVVGGVGAYVFLPSAAIVVTPRQEAMSIALVVRADPDVASPDATANLVPAIVLDVPVEVSDTFNATEKRVVEETAGGQVEFRSLDTGGSNTIDKGSIVSTEGGIKFKTTAAITLPRAQIIPPSQVRESVRTVGIVAVKPGTGGNVPPNSILVVPPGEDPAITKVRNLADTSGGTREEFPRVGQKDVDAAVTALTAKVQEAFAAQIDAGAGAPLNATLFPETAVLGTPTPTVDPATLVGKEQASFELGMKATGNVTAVDASPVVKIAETRLLANVGADYRLVEGSIEIVPGDPTVSNGEVTFPVNAKAARVRILDRGELLTLVKGRSIDEARSLLAEFGAVEVTPWPDWVSTIPGIDSRVTLEIVGQTDEAGEGSSPDPSGAASPADSAAP